jgi:hypothetical protein
MSTIKIKNIISHPPTMRYDIHTVYKHNPLVRFLTRNKEKIAFTSPNWGDNKIKLLITNEVNMQEWMKLISLGHPSIGYKKDLEIKDFAGKTYLFLGVFPIATEDNEVFEFCFDRYTEVK